MNAKKDYIVLAVIIFIAVVARFLKFDEPIVGTDVAAFSRLGKNLIETGRYAFGENYNLGVFFPPGYPFFIGIVNLFTGDLFFSAKIVSVVASCITILIAYLIGNELFNRRAGLFSAFCFAIHPLILIVSLQGWSDSLFFCFLLCSIYLFLLLVKRDSVFMYCYFGLFVSLSYMTRPEGMFLFVLPVLYLMGLFDGKTRIISKSLLKTALIFIIFFTLISPYAVFIKNYTGKFMLTGKNNISILLGELSSGDEDYHQIVNAPDNLYSKSAFSLNEEKTQLVGWNREMNRSVKEYLLKDPANLARKYLKHHKQQIKILVKLVLPVIIPLLLLFFLDRSILYKRMNLIFLLFPILYLFIYPLFIIIEKQTLLIVLYLIFLASLGYANTDNSIERLSRLVGLKTDRSVTLLAKCAKAMIIMVMIISSFIYLTYSSIDKGRSLVEHARAASYLKKNVSSAYENLNVMSAKPLVSFYSGAKYTMLPYANAHDVISFGKLYDVDYIVIDESLLGEWDYYAELAEMDSISRNAELVYEDDSEKMIRLFRIIR